MPEEKNTIRYLAFIVKKLLYPALAIMALHIVFVFSINRLFLNLPSQFPLLIAFVPLITFLIFFLINQVENNFKNNMAHYKYSLLFPFVFHDDPNPKKNDRIDIAEITKQMENCDIVLRRYNRYIDGLIFSENSYFTHVGIFCKDYKGFSSQVLHAEAKEGVHMTPFEDFCNCDEIAVLRFSFNESYEETEIRDQIIKEQRPPCDDEEIKKRELLVFNNLLKKSKSERGNLLLKDNDNDRCAEGYAQLILDRAFSLKDTPFDFEFNFKKFDQLSCIEYVWYCFKFLFPLHRIKVEDFEFFQLIKMPVIVPDVFLRNDFFDYVYTSLPNIRSKKELIEYAKSAQKQFWKFIGMILVWDIIFLFTSYLIFHSWGKIY